MSGKLYASLGTAMLLFLISIGACGGLTFTMFGQWRAASLLEDSYNEGKKQLKENESALDRLFLGPVDPNLEGMYEPLADSVKPEFATAKKGAVGGLTDNLDALFANHILPFRYLPWICLLVLVVFIYLSNKVFRPTFREYGGRMALTTTMVGLLGGYFGHLAVNNIYPMGIDLAGGTELIYRLDYTSTDKRIADLEQQIKNLREKKANNEKDISGNLITDEMVRAVEDNHRSMTDSKKSTPEKAADVVRKRIDPNGTRGIPVTRYGEDRLRIQLPKASPEDVLRIKRAIKTQGRLAFNIVTDDQEIIQKVQGSPDKQMADYQEVTIKNKKKYDEEEFTEEKIVIHKTPAMAGERIVYAGYKRNVEKGGFEINLRFDAAGAAKFTVVTSKNLHKRMAIMLDDVCYMAPTIQGVISSDCQITGSFTQKDAEFYASILTAGSLPAEVKPDYELQVGPSLGLEQIESGVLATLIGAILVSLFMWIYYRVGGFIAVVCLGVNLAVLMGALGFFKATMTLPGIAGILLTLGMAVDANVLIYERIREELKRGRTLRQAVQQGFERAGVTIIDSQLTTLLSGIILYYLGTGPIRGFAVTLSLGILVTLFANFWVCRNLVEWLVNGDILTDFKGMRLLDNAKFDFMGIRKPVMWVSSALVFASFAGFFVMGILDNKIYDLDFTGGSLVQFNFAEGKEQEKKSVVEVVEKTLWPKFQKELEDASKELKAVAHSEKKDSEMREELYKKLPDLGRSQFGTASEVNKLTLEILAGEFEEVLKDFKGVRADVEPFSKALKGEVEKYRSFTLTTRLTQNAAIEVLTRELVKAFGDKLELPATEQIVRDTNQLLKIRFKPFTELTDENLKIGLQSHLTSIQLSKENDSIKNQLGQLKLSGIMKEPYGAGQRSYIEVSGMPMGNSEFDHIRDLVVEGQKELAEGAISRKSTFGSQVAGEMRSTALLAALGAMAGIFMYLWFRFQFSSAWGFGAIVALIHDSVISIGAVCLVSATGILPVLIDLNLVAAILTIIGYSVNDTIVVFDRIREIRTQHPTRDFMEVLNEAINATLSRTILTSGTTLLAVLSMFLFGGDTIRDLSFTLLVGISVGTYSSIFIASPLLMWWANKYGVGRAPVPGTGKTRDDAAPSGAQI